MRLKNMLVAGVTVPLFALAACTGSGTDEKAGADASASSSPQDEKAQDDEAQGDGGQKPQTPQMPEPDLDGIPEVVAEVDGEEITKKEFVDAYESQFQQQAMQAQMSGQELDQDALKKQTAESLVSNELLVQEAAARDISASEAAVDKTLKEVAAQNKMSAKQFLAALAKQGMDEDTVRGQLETQVKLDGLIADEAGDIKATEAEMRALYKQAKAQGGGSGQKLPPYQKVKPQLAEQVETDKQNQVAQKLVGQLRERADVTIHL